MNEGYRNRENLQVILFKCSKLCNYLLYVFSHMNEISPALDMYIEYRTLNKQYFPHIPRDSKVSAKSTQKYGTQYFSI